MELLGYYRYKTFSMGGLGTVAVFWLLYVACLGVLLMMWPCKENVQFTWIRRLREWIFEILFFKGIVLLVMELYLEYFIYIYFHAFGQNFNDQ